MHLNLKGGAPRSYASKECWDPRIPQRPCNLLTPVPRPYHKESSMRRRNVPEHKPPPTESPPLPPVTDTNKPRRARTKRNGTWIWARYCLPWSLLCITLLLTLLTATHTNNWHRIGIKDESLLPTVRRNIHIAVLLYVSCASSAFCTLLPTQSWPCWRQRSQPRRPSAEDHQNHLHHQRVVPPHITPSRTYPSPRQTSPTVPYQNARDDPKMAQQ